MELDPDIRFITDYKEGQLARLRLYEPPPVIWRTTNRVTSSEAVKWYHVRGMRRLLQIASVCKVAREAARPFARAIYHKTWLYVVEHTFNTIHYPKEALDILQPHLGATRDSFPIEWYAERVFRFAKMVKL